MFVKYNYSLVKSKNKMLRSSLTAAILMFSTFAMAKVYYVAPNGTDAIFPTRGTFNAPWRSWHYAMNHVTPGDTVYFRGGVYTDYYSPRIGVKLQDSTINGTHNNYTCFFAYPSDWNSGNYPILDCWGMYSANSYNVGIEISKVNYIHFKGLTVRNVPQTYHTVYGAGYGFYIWAENYTTNPYRPGTLKFENCVAHNVPADGFKTHAIDTAYFINCDSFNNMDSLTTDADVGGQGTGFNVGTSVRLSNNADNSYIHLYGCRAWNCSDQGFANGARSRLVMESCWAIANGNNPLATNTERKGSGVKLWLDALSGDMTEKVNTTDLTQIIIRNCIFAYSPYAGINWTHFDVSTSHPEIRAHIYNNFIYGNVFPMYNFRGSYGYGIGDGGHADTTRQWDHRYWNNISYNNMVGDGLNGVFAPDKTAKYNLFDVSTSSVTDHYFVSLDTTGMLGVGTRKPDGSLPDTDFGKPAPGSPLIDAGLNISEYSNMEGISPLLFEGSAPDIGWAEYTSGAPAVPTFINAVIGNATPASLEMTFNLPLANIVPSTTAFTVMVNGSARTVSSVSVSGTKVLLILSTPVVYGNTITVAYTKPASNPVQTAAGGQVATFTAKSVTNNVAAIIPVYVSSVIENATASRLDITYNLTLASFIPAPSAFTVTVNGSARTVSSVSVAGTKVLLSLASPVVYGDAVTVAYTKPLSNPLQTASGGQAVSFTAKSVTNNVAAGIPSYVSSVVENATPSRIDLTFNLTLANVVPAASVFNVTVNGSARTISSVSVSGTKILLTLASPVVYGNTVTVAYTKPSSNPIQTTAGGQAASFAAKSVTNNVAAVNQSPSVEISSPTKSTTFVAPANITITAVASDPNGTIVKVEFYQGVVKLGELTSAPYSFIWKEVQEGTYSITVAATDNQNLRTVSTAVTVVVEKSSTQINQLPVVNITIPNNKKPKKHDNVIIVAEATDPDGAVAKVELKNGEVIIAEMTTSPYVFTLRDIDTGTYQFTAIATDNLGAINYSQTLELRVDDYYDENSEIIRLFPNPNEGNFKIDILTILPEGNNQISIFNSSGMSIYSSNISETENPVEINLEHPAPGSYILMITNDKRIMATKKLIIIR